MKRFITEYTENNELFVGEVDAIDWEHAEQISDLSHKVVGVMYAVIKAKHWTSEDADRFAQALADCAGDPPDTSEFEPEE